MWKRRVRIWRYLFTYLLSQCDPSVRVEWESERKTQKHRQRVRETGWHRETCDIYSSSFTLLLVSSALVSSWSLSLSFSLSSSCAWINHLKWLVGVVEWLGERKKSWLYSSMFLWHRECNLLTGHNLKGNEWTERDPSVTAMRPFCKSLSTSISDWPAISNESNLYTCTHTQSHSPAGEKLTCFSFFLSFSLSVHLMSS